MAIGLLSLIVLSLLVGNSGASAPDFRPKDYIVIAHESLDGPALQSLLANRFGPESWRYAKHAISDGVTADSVKRIISRYYDSTEYAPLYVLLVGTAKRKGGLTSDATLGNLIPSHYRSDAFGNWAAYDRWYVYLEPGDVTRRVPRASISRIPARTEAELQSYVSKLLIYETSGGDAPWKRSALFLSGDLDRGPDLPSPEAVDAGVADLIDSLPGIMSSSVIRYSDYGDDNEREQALIDALDPPSGKGLVAALATGSSANNLAYIVKRPDFDASSELQVTSSFPVILAQSCNLGQVDVDAPSSLPSLAENVLMAPDRGAIAIIGPSGFTSDVSNTPFLLECFRGVFRKGTRELANLGMAAAVVCRSSQHGATDTYDMISILGDPGLTIDLGSASVGQSTLAGTMEITEQTPVQCTPQGTQVGVENIRAGVVKSGQILGQRSYKIEGDDVSAGDATNAWVVFDRLGLTIGPDSRFLTYRVKPITHPEGVGRFGIDCWLTAGVTLSGCTTCGPRLDQYGTDILAVNRTGTLGEEKFYAFDLIQAYGVPVDKVLITYDASNSLLEGPFEAIYDNVSFVAEWGYPPQVSPIEMISNVVRNATADVSISVSDPDMPGLGDEFSCAWTVTHGYVSGQGLDVTYHAPGTTHSGAVITATVTDKGGHTIVVTKAFNIVNPPPPPTCPHIYAWNGSEYADQGAVLTRSRIDIDVDLVPEFLPILTMLSRDNGVLRFSLREDGNDISTLEQVELVLVKSDMTRGGRLGIAVDGSVKRLRSPVAASQCRDGHGFDQLAKVIGLDGISYTAFGPGSLELWYAPSRFDGAFKIGSESAEDGGLGIPGPPKEQYKRAALVGNREGEPDLPNLVTVSVFSDSATWDPVCSVAPRSFETLPDLVALAPYVDGDRGLWVKIEWTWSFSVDDLSYYEFTNDGLAFETSDLIRADHSARGASRSALLAEDDVRVFLEPGQRIDLEFDATTSGQFDFALLSMRGKYSPATESRIQFEATEFGTNVSLNQNSPNPFNTGTQISVHLPRSGDMRLVIYNALGQEVTELEHANIGAGHHEFIWDGTNRHGRQVSTGVYFYSLWYEGRSYSRKMVVLK